MKSEKQDREVESKVRERKADMLLGILKPPTSVSSPHTDPGYKSPGKIHSRRRVHLRCSKERQQHALFANTIHPILSWAAWQEHHTSEDPLPCRLNWPIGNSLENKLIAYSIWFKARNQFVRCSSSDGTGIKCFRLVLDLSNRDRSLRNFFLPFYARPHLSQVNQDLFG